MEWKKIFANLVSEKGLITRINKDLLQLNKNTIKKIGKAFEYTFIQRRYTYSQQPHEKMLNITYH